MKAYYGNIKSLDEDHRSKIKEHENEFSSQLMEPCLYLAKDGHFTSILFDNFEDKELLSKILQRIHSMNVLRRYNNHTLEDRLSNLK